MLILCLYPGSSQRLLRGVVADLFFPSRRRHTRFDCDWSSDVCSSDLYGPRGPSEIDVAAPRYRERPRMLLSQLAGLAQAGDPARTPQAIYARSQAERAAAHRSEERRVGEEGRSRGAPDH